jgi:signal transduction histidine kinase
MKRRSRTSGKKVKTGRDKSARKRPQLRKSGVGRGSAAIKAEAQHGAFHVSVRDTGPGISAADQANLFQEFQQADNAITRKKGGTGLGLAISKRIIEIHGGRIWVESQPGRGSTFAFTVPVLVERQAEPA